MLRQCHGREHYLQYRVPADDTHTLFFEIYFTESDYEKLTFYRLV